MLTNQGFKLLITLFILSIVSSTVSVNQPLTLSIFVVTFFALVYFYFAVEDIRRVRANDFGFSRKLSKTLPKAGEKFEVVVNVVNLAGRKLRVMVLDNVGSLNVVSGSSVAEGYLGHGEAIAVRYVLLAGERGLYRLGPVSVRVSDDYGLVCRYITLEEEYRLVVASAGSEKPRLSDAVKKVEPTLFTGSGSSYQQGVDDVFRELTLYEEGQPLKSIDWRRTARENGEIYVRKYDKLNLLKVLFLVDCSRANQLGKPSILDSSLSAVSAAALSMLEKGDVVSVATVGSSKPELHSAYGMKDYEGLVKFLSAVSPGKSYDLFEYVKELGAYHVVFMVGRFVGVDGPTLRKVFEHFRRGGGILFTLIPMTDAKNRIETALNELEKQRVESLKQYCSYVYAVKQNELLPHLIHLHKTMRMTA